MKRPHPLVQLLLARIRDLYREPAVLFWVYGFPLFLAVGLGIAFAGGMPTAPGSDWGDHPPVDIQRSPYPEAEQWEKQLKDHDLPVEVHDAEECLRRLQTGKIALFLVPHPPRYEYHFDPTRPGTQKAFYQVDDILQTWRAGPRALVPVPKEENQPGGRYIDYLIPGLMGLNLMGGGLWGVGFVIVDMRVRKLLKRLLATPMRKSDLLLSILGSRLLFVVPEMLALLLVGTLGFGVPIRGSLGTLALVILTGGVAFAGLGLLLASRTERTETVSGLINLLVLPMWMLTGTFFPPDRFPAALQPLIQFLPLTHLNVALRAVMLDGASLAEVAVPLAILAGWAVVSFFLALRLFRWL